jgi:hypothetical protein
MGDKRVLPLFDERERMHRFAKEQMRRIRLAAEALGDATESSRSPGRRRPTGSARPKIGRPPELTPREIARGIAMIRRADREHRKKYPKQKMKIADAVNLLLQNLKRHGKLLAVSANTLKRHIIWPARRPK